MSQKKPATRQEPDFEATVSLAARFDEVFGAPWVTREPGWKLILPDLSPWNWPAFANVPPPKTDGTPGAGFWRTVMWAPAEVDMPLQLGHWWGYQDPTYLSPYLLDEPSSYVEIVPLPLVAAIRSLELDARAWVRYADTRPGLSADRKARKSAQGHREHCAAIQRALDRFGGAWWQDAVEQLEQVEPVNTPSKRKAKRWA